MTFWLAVGLGTLAGLSTWSGRFIGSVIRRDFTNDLFCELPGHVWTGIIGALVVYSY